MKSKKLFLMIPAALVLIGCGNENNNESKESSASSDATTSSIVEEKPSSSKEETPSSSSEETASSSSEETPPSSSSSEEEQFVECDLATAKAKIETIKAKLAIGDYAVPSMGGIEMKSVNVENAGGVSATLTSLMTVSFDRGVTDPYYHVDMNMTVPNSKMEIWLYKDNDEYISATHTRITNGDKTEESKTASKYTDLATFLNEVYTPTVAQYGADTSESGLRDIAKSTFSELEYVVNAIDAVSSSSSSSEEEITINSYKLYVGKGDGDIKIEVNATQEGEEEDISFAFVDCMPINYCLKNSQTENGAVFNWGEVTKTHPDLSTFTIEPSTSTGE